MKPVVLWVEDGAVRPHADLERCAVEAGQRACVDRLTEALAAERVVVVRWLREDGATRRLGHFQQLESWMRLRRRAEVVVDLELLQIAEGVGALADDHEEPLV